MSFSSFKYLTRTGMKSMVRNRLMSIASIGVLAVCLLITGGTVLFSLNVGSLMDYLQGQNESVVYLDRELSEEGLAEADQQIRSISGISKVTYMTREEALVDMRESMGEYSGLFDVFEGDENPFAASYRVALEDVSQINQIIPQLEKIPGVIKVMAPVQMAEMFTSLYKAINGICILLVAVLCFVSVVVISNTIRLTVFARRKEISIMKYVGATNGFIRMPFFAEGVTVGLIAGIITSVLVMGGYQLLLTYGIDSSGFWGQMLSGVLIPLKDLWWQLLVSFLGFGALIGSMGTALSIRKYLKV